MQILLRQNIETSPAAVFGRDGIILQPMADGIVVKISAGFDRAVKVIEIEGFGCFFCHIKLTAGERQRQQKSQS